MAARLVIGFRLVFANACSPVLAAELSHPRDRQVITSLYQTTLYLGAIMAAWTTFGTYRIPNNWSWRIPSLLQAAPPLIQTAFLFFLPNPRASSSRRAEPKMPKLR